MAAEPGIVTSGTGPPNTVVQIQPGMQVQPVVLVDQNGNYISGSGSTFTAGYLADLTGTVYVAGAAAPTAGEVLTATNAGTATWQASAGGPPSGAAGGALNGTYPNPGLATVPITEGGTGGTSATIAFNNLSPLTTLGDVLFENASPAAARLAGNTTSTKNFLTQTGNGTISSAPAWGTITAGDLPAAGTAARGGVNFTGTAATIQPDGVQSAGGLITSYAPYADHVHQNNAFLSLFSAPTNATGETFPRWASTAENTAGNTGSLYAGAIGLPSGVPVNNITLFVDGQAAGSPTHGWVALLDSSRIVRAVSADQGTLPTWGTTSTAATVSVAASEYTTTYGGLYYIAYCITAGTMPRFTGCVSLRGFSASPVLQGTAATGYTSTPPAAGGTIGTLTGVQGYGFYAYTS